MTIKELRDILKLYEPDATVYLSRDPEGNGIHNIHEVAVYGEDDEKQVVIWPHSEYLELEE